MLNTTLLSLILIFSVNYVCSIKSEAKCDLKRNPSFKGNLSVEGTITLSQETPEAEVIFNIQISGFTLAGESHGFHVHESADIEANCEGAKGHFNPHNKTHGGQGDAERHVGDLGNLVVDANNKISRNLQDNMVSLNPKKPENIINKAIVLHEKTDDLGLGGNEDSKKTGNAGARLACCVITCTGGDCISMKGSAIFQARASWWNIVLAVFIMTFKYTIN